jgi:hypothetical protein
MAATDNNREQGEQEPSRPRYEVENHVTSFRDDDVYFRVRRNGKLFYIQIYPSRFVNSPATTEKYMSYLEVLRSGEEVIDDIYETDVLDWATQPFESFFVELAPDPAPPGGYGDIRVTLWDYMSPEFFVFELDIIDEELRPHQVDNGSFMSRSRRLPHDDLDPDLESWTTVYGPAEIILSFKNPEDALFKEPHKVLIDNEQTECFYKPCNSRSATRAELNAYKKIAAAGLDSRLRVCHLYGVVMGEDDAVEGLLLTYINDGYCTLGQYFGPDQPTAEVKQRWADEIESTLAELHKAGVVWGDVKGENVLLDPDRNPWIIDFGGGYTPGWVDKEAAGTVEGDLVGMAKLREYILMIGEPRERPLLLTS